MLYLGELREAEAIARIQNDLKDKGLGSNLSSQDLLNCLKEFDGDVLATSVFLEKYTLRDHSGNLLEHRLSEAKLRWAKAISKVSSEKFGQNDHTVQYFRELYDYFFPAGRQMLGLGNELISNLTLSNCYCTSTGDSLEEIFNTAFKIAKTFAFAGGQGIDISPLRPAGAITNNAARHSSGAVSFADLFSFVTKLIGQEGRRGALILLLDITHPSILEYVTAKIKDKDRLRFANISVKVTDDFMEALEKGKDVDLSFKSPNETFKQVINSEELWNTLVESACKSGDPGLIFWDTIKRWSPSEIYPELRIAGTNPCGELPLEIDGACVLGSMLLPRFVKNPFTEEAEFDFDLFREMVKRAVEHLDNVIEINIKKHPLEEQRLKASLGRRMGLGFTGLADVLAMLGAPYDSSQSEELAEEILDCKQKAEYQASVRLAAERGPFPLWKKEHWNQEYCRTFLPKEGIERGPLRNVSLSAVAPTGSLSIVAQCSSGIEPVFQREMTRVIELGKNRRTYKVLHHGLVQASQITKKSIDKLNHLFPASHEIDPDHRILIQSTIQRYIDSSISSTINLPRGTRPDVIDRIYRKAYEEGLKGITVYVEGSKEGILLSKEERVTQEGELDTTVYRFTAEGGDKFYVHVSYLNGDISRPYQFFITNYKANENDRFVKLANDIKRALTDETGVDQGKLQLQLARSDNSLCKITRLISLAMKSNCLGLIQEILEDHAFVGTLAARLVVIFEKSIARQSSTRCPGCEEDGTLQRQEGCILCSNCGYSACS